MLDRNANSLLSEKFLTESQLSLFWHNVAEKIW